MRSIVKAGAVAAVVFLLPNGSSPLMSMNVQGADTAPNPMPISVQLAALQPVDDVKHAFGHIRPAQVISISMPRQPAPVAEILVHEGELVRQGQLLARLDDREAKDALLRAQGDLRSALADLAETDSLLKLAESEAAESVAELERLSQLARKGASTVVQRGNAERALERALLDVEASRSRREKALVRVDMLRITVDRATQLVEEMHILAPVSGRVIGIDAQPGATFAAGAALISLAEEDRIEAVLRVPSGTVTDVKVGDPVRLWLAQDLAAQGNVARIVPSQGQTGALAEVVVTLNDDVVAVSGTALRGEIITDRRMAMLVPTSALVQLPSGTGVLRVIDNRVVETPVTIAARPDGTTTEIIAGLPEDAAFATVAGSLLRDGSRVQPILNTARQTPVQLNASAMLLLSPVR